MEPPAATARVAGGKCEVWAPVQSPGRHARRAGQEARPQAGGRDGQRHVARRRLRPQVEVRLRARGGIAVARDGRRAGEGDVDARGRPPSRLSTTPSRPSASRPGSTRSGKVVAWRHRSVAPTILSTFVPDPKHRAAGRARHGLWSTCRSISPNMRCESRRGRGAHAHRLVPLGVQHPACLCDPVVRRRARRTRPGGTRRTVLLELIGPPRIVDPRKHGHDRVLELRRPVRDLPDRHGAAAARSSSSSAERRNGASKLPTRHGLGIAVHRSFVSYVATVVEVAVDDKGNITVPRVDTAIDCGFCRQPRAHPLADRRRGGDGAEPRQIWRDQLQERPRRAEQLRRLPGRCASTSRRR